MHWNGAFYTFFQASICNENFLFFLSFMFKPLLVLERKLPSWRIDKGLLTLSTVTPSAIDLGYTCMFDDSLRVIVL